MASPPHFVRIAIDSDNISSCIHVHVEVLNLAHLLVIFPASSLCFMVSFMFEIPQT